MQPVIGLLESVGFNNIGNTMFNIGKRDFRSKHETIAIGYKEFIALFFPQNLYNMPTFFFIKRTLCTVFSEFWLEKKLH